MSFWPLPRKITESLEAAATLGPLLELGAGDGAMARRLRELGHTPILVDRRDCPSRPNEIRLRADMTQLPLKDGVAGALIVANTLRQLEPGQRARFATEARRCLSSDGILVLMEDHPEAIDAAATNYRRILNELARVDTSRGTTLAPTAARDALVPVLGNVLSEGRVLNQERVSDPLAPLRWLRAHLDAGQSSSQLDALEKDIRDAGVSYGEFWFQVYGREGRGAA